VKQENLAFGYGLGGRRARAQISLVRYARLQSWEGQATLPWAENKVPWLMVAVHGFWAL